MEEIHIMEDTTSQKPDGANYSRDIIGVGFNLLVGELSGSLEFIDYAV